ncbi:carboxypeptidase-like regulatory domain-containing protein [Puteibacter caeruleilacunae]|nr:carboxypeptidase-like regulatory domain-containing protein [Puteibacter caeruleilacunae]
MIKKLFIFLVAAVTSLQIMAQNEASVITGRVVNLADNKPVAFANIAIEGTFVGVASDADGFFQLNVPAELKGKPVFFSAIGFKMLRKGINELQEAPLVVKMEPQAYSLVGVDVAARSKVIFRIIKNVVKNIEQNYLAQPFVYNAFFKEEQFKNNEMTRTREADVELYDEAGYKRMNKRDAFTSRHYRMRNTKTNVKALKLADGQQVIDDLLSFDIVRSQGNILDVEFLNDYDLSIEQETKLGNDSVWIIAYRLSNPDLPRTGDFFVNNYGGKLYVNKANYAVLKNETWVETTGKNYQGRSLAGIPSAMQSMKKNSYKFVVSYVNKGGKYQLSHIAYSRKGAAITADASLMEIASIIVDKSGNKPAKPFKGREYVEYTK